MRKILLVGLVVAAISMSLANSSEAMDAFLWVEGVRGESVEKVHREWIDLTSFTWGHKVDPSRGMVSFDTLSIEKWYDSTSPALALSGATSQHIPKLILEIMGPQAQRIERVELQDVIVTTYAVEVPQGQALSALARPTEKVSFRFARIFWEYFGPTGSLIAKKGYDLLLNKPL